MSEMWKAKLTDSNLSLDLSQWDVSNVETFASMFDLANDVVKVNLPSYFYTAWVENRLVTANKMHL